MSHNHDVISSYRDENCRFSRFLGDQNSHQLCLHASTTQVKSFQPCISSDSVSDSLSIQIPMFNQEFSFLVMTHNFLFMHTTATPEGSNFGGLNIHYLHGLCLLYMAYVFLEALIINKIWCIFKLLITFSTRLITLGCSCQLGRIVLKIF